MRKPPSGNNTYQGLPHGSLPQQPTLSSENNGDSNQKSLTRVTCTTKILSFERHAISWFDKPSSTYCLPPNHTVTTSSKAL